MTVIKRFRSESELEVIRTAQKLRKDITMLMLRDFRVKPKVLEPEPEVKAMPPEDSQMFLAIAEKHGLSKAGTGWPARLIGKVRDSLSGLLRPLVLHATAGNSICPVTFADAELRRKYQDSALAACAQICQEPGFSSYVLPAGLTKYLPYLEAADYETALLKGWRKSDNKRCRELQHHREDVRLVGYRPVADGICPGMDKMDHYEADNHCGDEDLGEGRHPGPAAFVFGVAHEYRLDGDDGRHRADEEAEVEPEGAPVKVRYHPEDLPAQMEVEIVEDLRVGKERGAEEHRCDKGRGPVRPLPCDDEGEGGKRNSRKNMKQGKQKWPVRLMNVWK